MTTQKTTPKAATKTNTQKAKTISGARAEFTQGCITNLDLMNLHKQEMLKAHPELAEKTDASRKQQLGLNGLQARLHATGAAALSGMTNGAIKLLLNDTNLESYHLTELPKNKGGRGLAGYAKNYLLTMLECVAQDKTVNGINLTDVNNAIKKTDPEFKGKTRGDSCINCLMVCLKDLEEGKDTVSLNHWDQVLNGVTQGRYIFNLLCDAGLAENKGGTGYRREIKFKMDHPMIKKLKEIAVRNNVQYIKR